MNYGFFFDYNNDTIRLPVNPEKFSISIEQEGTKKNVVGLGAINIIGNVKLQKILEVKGLYSKRLKLIFKSPSSSASSSISNESIVTNIDIFFKSLASEYSLVKINLMGLLSSMYF